MSSVTKTAIWKLPLGTSASPSLGDVRPRTQDGPYRDSGNRPVETGTESIRQTVTTRSDNAGQRPDQPTVDWQITSMDDGQLNGDDPVLHHIRRYANRVVKGDDWPLEDIDLSKITFETRPRAKRRHGVSENYSDGTTTIGISQHSLENGDEEGIRELIRHELIHAWQNQHLGTTVELPNGETVENVTRGHTGNWSTWEDLMDVQRTIDLYDRVPEQYKYVFGCSECDQWGGRFRLCKTIRQAVRGELNCTCGGDIHIVDPDGLLAEHADLPDHVIRGFFSWD